MTTSPSIRSRQSLLDRYLTAAQESRLAVGTPLSADGFRSPGVSRRNISKACRGTRGGVLLPYTFPRDGEYEIRVRLARDRNEHVEGLRGRIRWTCCSTGALKQFTIKKLKNNDHDEIDKHLVMRTRRACGVTFPARSVSLGKQEATDRGQLQRVPGIRASRGGFSGDDHRPV